MKDYKLSELKEICAEHNCDVCPIFKLCDKLEGLCCFYDLDIDEVQDETN